jgi:hypothetical protein
MYYLFISHVLGTLFIVSSFCGITRLDQKKTPYDLVWEDGYCLAGKVNNFRTSINPIDFEHSLFSSCFG